MDINFGPTEQVLWPLSILSGIIMCKIVYDVTHSLSSRYFKGYAKLSKSQKIEWNNRGFSTFHAIVIAVASFYLVVLSDLFKDGSHDELMIRRKSVASDATFGISLGYFLSDLGMILWLFPALGGKEYLIHHGISMYAISLALLGGEAHFYILMVLFSEITTPFINLRWYLDIAGQKSSKLYLWNGIAMSIGWLVARILLFIYFFTHMYLHFDQAILEPEEILLAQSGFPMGVNGLLQMVILNYPWNAKSADLNPDQLVQIKVKTIFTVSFYSILVAPSILAVMNAFWFWKILRGLKKAISRKTHTQ